MPPQRHTVDIVIEICRKKFPNELYDYSLFTHYTNGSTIIPIICHKKSNTGEEHGIFNMSAKKHKAGHGCTKCPKLYNEKCPKINSTEDLIREGIAKYGNKHEYTNAVFVNMTTYVEFICTVIDRFGVKHGSFEQTPKNYFGRTCECSKCHIGRQTKPQEEFEQEANEIHNNFYIYHNDYKGAYVKINVTCPNHGNFLVTPHNHTNAGSGCPSCRSSHGERKIKGILNKYKIPYKTQHTFSDFICIKAPFRFDFKCKIFNVDCMIEMDGEQHFKAINYFGGDERFKTQQEQDFRKDQYCHNNNIPMLRVSYADIDNIEHHIYEFITILRGYPRDWPLVLGTDIYAGRPNIELLSDHMKEIQLAI